MCLVFTLGSGRGVGQGLTSRSGRDLRPRSSWLRGRRADGPAVRWPLALPTVRPGRPGCGGKHTHEEEAHMTVRVGINGFGRIGRVFTRLALERTDDALIVAGDPIPVLSERDPARIDWAKLGADIVIESTGKFRTRDGAALHLKGGALKVLISAPGKDVDLTIVLA